LQSIFIFGLTKSAFHKDAPFQIQLEELSGDLASVKYIMCLYLNLEFGHSELI